MNKNHYNNTDYDTLRYYNASFTNGTDRLQPAQISDTRTSPIIENAGEWVMSVIRFDVSSSTIPLNLPQILVTNPPQTGPNYTLTSTITLGYHGVFFTQPIIYVETAVPPNPLRIPTIYNYDKFLGFVNTALAAAFTALQVAFPAVVGVAPQFIYNPLNGLIDLYVDPNFIPAAGVNQISIYMNNVLSRYFIHFSFNVNTVPLGGSNLIFKLVIDNTNTVALPAVGSRQNLPLSVQAAPANLFMTSDSEPSTPSWNSLRSLILTSNLLPIHSEVTPSGTDTSSNYLSSNIFPILSDFLVPDSPNVLSNTRLINQYLPTAQYRYIDLVSTGSLFTIDLKMYWTDYLNNIYELFLDPGQGLNVKILFQKRDTIKYSKYSP